MLSFFRRDALLPGSLVLLLLPAECASLIETDRLGPPQARAHERVPVNLFKGWTWTANVSRSLVNTAVAQTFAPIALISLLVRQKLRATAGTQRGSKPISLHQNSHEGLPGLLVLFLLFPGLQTFCCSASQLPSQEPEIVESPTLPMH